MCYSGLKALIPELIHDQINTQTLFLPKVLWIMLHVQNQENCELLKAVQRLKYSMGGISGNSLKLILLVASSVIIN